MTTIPPCGALVFIHLNQQLALLLYSASSCVLFVVGLTIQLQSKCIQLVEQVLLVTPDAISIEAVINVTGGVVIFHYSEPGSNQVVVLLLLLLL